MLIDLNKITQDAINDLVDSGELEKQIKESIQETVKCTIKNNIRQYSQFGKAIEEKVEEAIKVNLGDITLPSYNQMILDQIQEAVDLGIKHGGKDELISMIKHIINPTKEVYTLSELIEQFKLDIINDVRDYNINKDEDENADLFLEIKEGNSYGIHEYHHIYMDERADLTHTFSARYQISLANGVPYSIKVEGHKFEPSHLLNRMPSLDKILLDIKTSGAKIELDRGNRGSSYYTEMYLGDEEEEEY